MEELRYLLMGVAGVLVGLAGFLVYKYSKLIGKRSASLSKEEVTGRLYSRKVAKFREETSAQSPAERFRQLNKVMRGFFSELFDIRYEFAYVELNEELAKKGVREAVRKEVISYTMEMSEAGYGGKEIDGPMLERLIDKSLDVIGKVTGTSAGKPAPGGAPAQLPAAEPPAAAVPAPKPIPAAEPVPEAASMPEEPPAEQEQKPPAEPEPEPAAPSAPPKKEKAPEPAGRAKAREKAPEERELRIPEAAEDRVQMIRKLLLEAEEKLREGKPHECLALYTDLRDLYDSLDTVSKRGALKEASRIIGVYNSLVKEYSRALEDARS